jgi:hypothetical protein
LAGGLPSGQQTRQVIGMDDNYQTDILCRYQVPRS